MRGGSITVEGNADSWVGREMVGGEILVKGNEAYYAGGEIVVEGNVRLLPRVLNWSGTYYYRG